VLLGGIGADIFGKRILFGGGLLLLSFGLLAFGLSPNFSSALLFLFIMGLGGGSVEILASALVADINSDRKGFFLNMSQVAFGLGAVLVPLLAGYVISRYANWRITYYIASGLGFLIFLGFIREKIPSIRQEDKINLPAARNLLSQGIFILINFSMAFYVGAEIAITGWMSTYLQGLGANPVLAGFSLSLFWVMMTIGRFSCGYLSEIMPLGRLLLIISAGGFFSIIASILTSNYLFTLISFALVGLFFSGAFPTILAYASSIFPRYSGTVFGICFASGGIGGMLFPYLVGLVAEDFNMRIGIGAMSILLAGMFGIFSYLTRGKRKYATSEV